MAAGGISRFALKLTGAISHVPSPVDRRSTHQSTILAVDGSQVDDYGSVDQASLFKSASVAGRVCQAACGPSGNSYANKNGHEG